MDQIQIIITASTIAWIALVLSAVSTIGQIVGLVRDRKKVVLKIERNMYVVGATTAFGYKEGVTYVSMNILNKGRRRVVLDSAGARLLDGSSLIAADILKTGQVALEDGKRHNVYIEESKLDFSKISYFFVRDAVGDVYKQNISNIFKRISWYTKRKLGFVKPSKPII